MHVQCTRFVHCVPFSTLSMYSKHALCTTERVVYSTRALVNLRAVYNARALSTSACTYTVHHTLTVKLCGDWKSTLNMQGAPESAIAGYIVRARCRSDCTSIVHCMCCVYRFVHWQCTLHESAPPSHPVCKRSEINTSLTPWGAKRTAGARIVRIEWTAHATCVPSAPCCVKALSNILGYVNFSAQQSRNGISLFRKMHCSKFPSQRCSMAVPDVRAGRYTFTDDDHQCLPSGIVQMVHAWLFPSPFWAEC